MKTEITIEKTMFNKNAIIIALQKYLDSHWVRIFEGSGTYLISFEKRDNSPHSFEEKVFFNELIESEFLSRKEKDTLELRSMIMKQILSPYDKKRA